MAAVDVSVIIPTYNRAAMLAEALDSVFAQDFHGTVEVIVVDDNSPDDTVEMVRQQYPEVRLICLTQNVGAYGARNQAILASNGQYIAFLDSDDFWEPTYLKTQIAALAGQDKCFCASAVLNWHIVRNEKAIVFPEPNFDKYSSSLHHLLAEGSFICTLSAVVFSRQTFTELGLFDETYRISGDNDFYIRCLVNGYQLISTASPSIVRRCHDRGQATDWSNLRVRKRIRLKQIERYYRLAGSSFTLPSVSVVRAQVHALYASRYYIRQRNILAWLDSSLHAVYHSPQLGLSSAWQDLQFYVSHHILRNFRSRVSRKFLGLFGIVHSA